MVGRHRHDTLAASKLERRGSPNSLGKGTFGSRASPNFIGPPHGNGNARPVHWKTVACSQTPSPLGDGTIRAKGSTPGRNPPCSGKPGKRRTTVDLGRYPTKPSKWKERSFLPGQPIPQMPSETTAPEETMPRKSHQASWSTCCGVIRCAGWNPNHPLVEPTKKQSGCWSDPTNWEKHPRPRRGGRSRLAKLLSAGHDGQSPIQPDTVTTPSTRVGRFPLAGETEERECEFVGPLGPGESENDREFITDRCQKRLGAR